MLKVFRDNLKYLSPVLWAVVAVFVLFVFVDFGATVPTGSAPNDSAVTVGDREVTFSEFRSRYQRMEEVYRQAYGEQFSPELARQMGLPLQVLNSLVAEKVLLAEAERSGLAATDEEVRRRILELDVFRTAQGAFIGEAEYQRILKTNGLSSDEFETSLRREILTGKLRQVVAHNVYVPASEVEEAYRDQTESAAIRYLRLPATEMSGEIEPTDDQITGWYDANAEELRRPEQRRVDYLLVDTARVRESIEVGDDEVREYYDLHLDEFTQNEQVRARHILLEVGADDEDAVRGQLEAIRGRIEGGEDFADLARELSSDQGTREDGGDLGYFGRGRMVKEFEDAAFGAPVGDLVGPFRSPFGFHLVEVLDRLEAGPRPLDEVASTVRSRLVAERARSGTEAKARQLAERIRAEDLKSEEALQSLSAEDESVVFASAGPFGEHDPIPGIGRGTPFTTAAFGAEAGEVSGPVQVARGWAILRLEEIVEPRVPPLAEVRDQVRRSVVTEMGLELARERMAGARERLAAGSTLEEVAEELGLEIIDSGTFQRTGPAGNLGDAPAVREAVFELSQGDLGGPVTLDASVVLFQVAERVAFDPTTYAALSEQTRNNLQTQRVDQLLASLVERRREEMGVTYNRQLLESFDLLDETQG